MALMDEIQSYIQEERDASKTYMKMADDAVDARMYNTAQTLRGMAADEQRHSELLEGMFYQPEVATDQPTA